VDDLTGLSVHDLLSGNEPALRATARS